MLVVLQLCVCVCVCVKIFPDFKVLIPINSKNQIPNKNTKAIRLEILISPAAKNKPMASQNQPHLPVRWCCKMLLRASKTKQKAGASVKKLTP